MMRVLFRERFQSLILERRGAIGRWFSSDAPRIKSKKTAVTVDDNTPPECIKISISPIGQPISNIKILVNDSDPTALADDQYPSWLFKELNKLEYRIAKRLMRAGRTNINIPDPPKLTLRDALKRERKSLINSNNSTMKR